MFIRLEGHDCRHALEQALLSWLPEAERSWTEPGAEPGPGEDFLLSGLYAEGDRPVSRCRLRLSGREAVGEASLPGPWPEEALLRRREEQRLVKLSFYRALTAISGEKAWGALTGVRPAKLAARWLKSLGDDPAAARAAMEREYGLSPEKAELCVKAGRVSRQTASRLEERDAVLYVGIPFCPSRCAYCSFVSHSVEKSMGLVQPYVEALCRELEDTAALAGEAGLRIRAFYMGGGTPTTLTAPQLDRILDLARRSFTWAQGAEWTVEAGRPDTVTAEKLETLARRGVGRISINPQTMEDAVLRAIGRRHTAEDILTCFRMAREVFPGQINMDLIAGLPEDREEGFRHSLDRVLSLEPENVTVHCLTRKRGADLNGREDRYPGEGEVRRMLDYAARVLPEAGYSPYYLYRQKFSAAGLENTGWARPGTECLYNVCMMEELCCVLSLGAGGVSKRVWPETGRIRRWVNKKYPYEYIRDPESAAEGKRRLILEDPAPNGG